MNQFLKCQQNLSIKSWGVLNIFLCSTLQFVYSVRPVPTPPSVCTPDKIGIQSHLDRHIQATSARVQWICQSTTSDEPRFFRFALSLISGNLGYIIAPRVRKCTRFSTKRHNRVRWRREGRHPSSQ